MSVWMLLREDGCVMPPEVLTCTKLIMGGHLENIDWAGLLVCKMEDSRLENCYFASHLQLLIKTQHEDFLRQDFYKVDSDSDSEEHSSELCLEQSDIRLWILRSLRKNKLISYGLFMKLRDVYFANNVEGLLMGEGVLYALQINHRPSSLVSVGY